MIIFRTFEHYPDDETNIEHDCIICFDYLKNDNITIDLNNQNKFIKKCNCILWVHENCLQNWHNISNTNQCPICRQNMYIKQNIINMICLNYKFIINKILENTFVLKNILIIVIVYNLTYIYLEIMHQKYNKL
jgi:hypothetical protein